MKVIGITGQVCTGKTTTINQIISLYSSVKVFSCDAIASQILTCYGISKLTLSKSIKHHPDFIFAIRDLIDSKVKCQLKQFISANVNDTVIAEVPLLFEANFQDLFDTIIATHCSEKTQKARIKSRPNAEILNILIEKQLSSSTKVAMCDITINSDLPIIPQINQYINLY